MTWSCLASSYRFFCKFEDKTKTTSKTASTVCLKAAVLSDTTARQSNTRA